jgi:hypothetical protein
MLAGCMVCSAAVGLSTVMLLTFTSTAALSALSPAAEAVAPSPLLWPAEASVAGPAR